jgi:hypothetical protein
LTLSHATVIVSVQVGVRKRVGGPHLRASALRSLESIASIAYMPAP